MAHHGSASMRKETLNAENAEILHTVNRQASNKANRETLASTEEEISHLTDPSLNRTLSRATRRRAMRIINNSAIDPTTRAFIRYSLDINDPWTLSLVRRAESGEIFDENFSLTTRQSSENIKELSIEYDPSSDVDTLAEYQLNEDEVQLGQSIDEKLEALTDLICRPGNEPDIKSGALLLLMATLENSGRPKSLATTAKYLAFLRCCELNFCGMVDKQLDLVERELLAS